MKRRGYDIGRVVDLIFEYWLGRMKDSELEEYRHMKETTGLDKYAREFEDREWIKNALEEPDIFETDKAYRRFWSMTAGKTVYRPPSLEMGGLVADSVVGRWRGRTIRLVATRFDTLVGRDRNCKTESGGDPGQWRKNKFGRRSGSYS